MRHARFLAETDFPDVEVKDKLLLRQATLAAGSRLGPLHADHLWMDEARLGRGALVHCTADLVEGYGVICAEPVQLNISSHALVDFPEVHSPSHLSLSCSSNGVEVRGAAFSGPATIGPVPDEPDGDTGAVTRRSVPVPRLDRVNAANLTLSGVDLRTTRLLDTYARDQLRIDGPPMMAGPPVSNRWTQRLVLAEEHLWRAKYDRRPEGWFPPECRRLEDRAPVHQPDTRRTQGARTEAAHIQSVYRDLRKGREDAKDEPGAADFYFGEMEMRRVAAAPHTAERAVLTLYWAVSGYGLRATRALAALFLVLLLGVVGVYAVGFAPSTKQEIRPVPGREGTYVLVTVEGPKPGLKAAFEFTIEAATSLVRSPTPRPLTVAGRMIELILRLIGPLLLGLAVLSLRGRVKR